MQNPIEQSRLLSHCAALILQTQPLLSLQILRLALLLAPREAFALQFAKEIFRRRGRFAAEQRVSELLATLTNATAVSPAPVDLSGDATQIRNMVATSLSPLDKETEKIAEKVKYVSIKSDDNRVADEIAWLETPPSDQKPVVASFTPREPDAQLSTKQDVFVNFLEQGSYDLEFRKLSVGFSPNHAGLVAYVNLLLTMRLLEEHEKTNALMILYRIIKENDDQSGAEELFDRFFMQQKDQREE